ncbi:hypothetical protein [Candidatus Phaeomarinobacter ectocarpi]|uniref:hypothetical protein n=1 Tax=Candidatus Phaeomarinibacter ectocarpi TaxID=1458461 RepID=UPI001494D2D6|nr:hypothetical protein [Candidatus Phaeomarinobacter ectocarpi]
MVKATTPKVTAANASLRGRVKNPVIGPISTENGMGVDNTLWGLSYIYTRFSRMPPSPQQTIKPQIMSAAAKKRVHGCPMAVGALRQQVGLIQPR